MHKPQKQVLEFHEAMDCHVAPRPGLKDYPFDLRLRLILEELLELAESSGGFVLGIEEETGKAFFTKDPSKEPDMLGMIDDICDILYVTFGAAVSMGVNIEPFFDCIHNANMAKIWPDGKAKHREDGKILKPQDWVDPAKGVKKELERQKGVQETG